MVNVAGNFNSHTLGAVVPPGAAHPFGPGMHKPIAMGRGLFNRAATPTPTPRRPLTSIVLSTSTNRGSQVTSSVGGTAPATSEPTVTNSPNENIPPVTATLLNVATSDSSSSSSTATTSSCSSTSSTTYSLVACAVAAVASASTTATSIRTISMLPPVIPATLRQVQQYLNTNDFDRAIKTINRILTSAQSSESYVNALFHRGMIYQKLSISATDPQARIDYDQSAVFDFCHVLARNPNHLKALNLRSKLGLKYHLYNNVVGDCDRILALQPNIIKIRERRVEANRQLGRIDLVVVDLQAIEDIEPNNFANIYRIAEVYFEKATIPNQNLADSNRLRLIAERLVVAARYAAKALSLEPAHMCIPSLIAQINSEREKIQKLLVSQ